MANFLKRWFTGVKTHTEKPTELDTYIQDRLIAIQERLALEHHTFDNSNLDSALATAPGRHKPGSVSACYVGATAPASPSIGCMYYDTDVGQFYVYNGTSWITVTPPNQVPQYAIFAYRGNVAPSGYAICNGSNGTPDLSGKFILASSTTRPYGTPPGGTLDLAHRHGLALAGVGHSHTFGAKDGTDPIRTVTTSTALVSVPADPTLYNIGLYPPYFVLTYIMKL